MKKAMLIFLSCTWGILMTFIGLLATLALLIAKHKSKQYGIGWYFVVGRRWGGVNLGLTTIVCAISEKDGHTLKHETGHALQNCAYGVFMPILVCVPSAVRYWWFRLRKPKIGTIPSKYDDAWFEGQATKWGYAYMEGENNG